MGHSAIRGALEILSIRPTSLLSAFRHNDNPIVGCGYFLCTTKSSLRKDGVLHLPIRPEMPSKIHFRPNSSVPNLCTFVHLFATARLIVVMSWNCSE